MYNENNEYNSNTEYTGQPTQQYYYGAYQQPVQEVPKKKNKWFAMKIVAVCLACVVVGGAAGAGVMQLFHSSEIGTPIDISSFYSNANQDSANQITPNQGETNQSTPNNSQQPQSSVNVNIGASSLTSPSSSSVYTGAELSAEDVYALGSQCVVGVSTEVMTSNIFGQMSSSAVSGTGFVISTDGYIMTNYHVVEEATGTIEVKLIDGESYEAELVGYEKDNDIAVLKIDVTGLVPVVLGNSADLKVGETVYAIGNPLGELTYTMTHGMVSALDREISTDDNVSINMFQIDAAINSGNSGGPVFNSKAEVIGVVTAKYADTGVEGLGFAIPIDDAVYIAKQLISYGYVTGKPYFGIEVRTVTEQIASYYNYNMVPGAYVQTVVSGSCAEKAGLKVGDIITKLGDTEIISTAELTAAKKAYKAGDSVEITVYRSGQYITLHITFDEQKPEQSTTAQQDTQTTLPENNPYGFSYGYGNWSPYGNSGYLG